MRPNWTLLRSFDSQFLVWWNSSSASPPGVMSTLKASRSPTTLVSPTIRTGSAFGFSKKFIWRKASSSFTGHSQSSPGFFLAHLSSSNSSRSISYPGGIPYLPGSEPILGSGGSHSSRRHSLRCIDLSCTRQSIQPGLSRCGWQWPTSASRSCRVVPAPKIHETWCLGCLVLRPSLRRVSFFLFHRFLRA